MAPLLLDAKRQALADLFLSADSHVRGGDHRHALQSPVRVLLQILLQMFAYHLRKSKALGILYLPRSHVPNCLRMERVPTTG